MSIFKNESPYTILVGDSKIIDEDDVLEWCQNTDGFVGVTKTDVSDVSYTDETHLIFGSETSGLPQKFHDRWPEKFVKIPQKESVRCLNLSNSVAIGLYEGWRQLNFQ